MADIRIGVVSPMALANDTMGAAFAELWPEAQVINLLDESLYADFAGGQGVTDETYRRVAGSACPRFPRDFRSGLVLVPEA